MCSALVRIRSIHCLVGDGLMQLLVVRLGADGCDEEMGCRCCEVRCCGSERLMVFGFLCSGSEQGPIGFPI